MATLAPASYKKLPFKKDSVLTRLEVGDSYELIAALPRASVDLVISSPPYWGQRDYGQSHDWEIARAWKREGKSREEVPAYQWYRDHGGLLGLEPYPAWFVEHLAEIIDRAKGCLKNSGSMWINLGDTYFARWSSIRQNGRQGLGDQSRKRRRTPMGGYCQEKQLLLIPARFAISMQERGWILRNDLIWSKPNVPPRPERDRLRLAHEHFFHFVKKPTEGRAKYHYDVAEVESGARDVITCFVKPGENGHTATFPEQLIRPRILSSCPPGGTVLDPFCGTGRALRVALQTGRNVIGFDIVSDYIRSIKQIVADGQEEA